MTSTEEMLAIVELRTVAERYAFAVDRGDGPVFAAQFTEDGELEAPRGRFVGRESLATVPSMMRRLYDRTHHGVVGQCVHIAGDEATGETYAHARHYFRDSAGVEYCYEMTVRYDDAFSLTGGRWLLARRKLVLIGDARYPTGGRPGNHQQAAGSR